MKKVIVLSMLVIAGAGSALSQGTIVIGNPQNMNPDINATSRGMVWTNDGKGGIGPWDGSQYNLSVTALAGPSSDSLTPLITVLEDDPRYTGFDVGRFNLTWNEPMIFTLTSVPGTGTAWIHLKLWWSAGGPVYSSYELAVAGGAFVGEALFANPTGGVPPGGGAQVPPTTLTEMPAIVLAPIPEPCVFALAGLGLASLLIFRRRK